MSSISDDEWSVSLEESLRDEDASFYIFSFQLRGAPHGATIFLVIDLPIILDFVVLLG